jgi:hypothetical protein
VKPLSRCHLHRSLRKISVHADCDSEKIAGEPVSRILSSHAFQNQNACGGDHSSRSRLAPQLKQPTRGLLSTAACAVAEGAPPLSRTLTRRAGPALPSYLALHHAGFSVPRVLPHERWALTPPFHPYQRNELCEDVPQVFLRDATVPFRWRYVFCGTFRERTGQREPKPAPPKSLPWRYQARCPYLTPAVKRMKVP